MDKVREYVKNILVKLNSAIAYKNAWKMRNKKVDFLICGTQKGGTTALDEYLRDNPEICMATQKEVHYFNNVAESRIKALSYASYHKFFNPSDQTKVIGEATPLYMYWHSAPDRIREYNPRIKLIISLRDPVQRSYSQWNMHRQWTNSSVSFHDFFQKEIRNIDKYPFGYCTGLGSAAQRSLYSIQIRNIWKLFPKNQVLIIRQDNLLHDPQTTINEICEFLGVSSHIIESHKVVHRREYNLKLGSEDEKLLRDFFYEDVCRLEKMLDWDLSDWK